MARPTADRMREKIELGHFIRDLFQAGLATTSSTISWAMLCFGHYPEFREKIAEEISETIDQTYNSANYWVCTNLWAVHHNSDYFKNPDGFRPERFLDSDGKFIHLNHVIAFSVGSRRCIREKLARMPTFLLIAGIVQKLRVVMDPDNPSPIFLQGSKQFCNL
uniref:steroid 17-alpha-hydroxylase/17,20 lyase-like n=1 Tax=Styela clava TaxID=7725 RepID=UPI0019394AA2|nr:steroid 17-alpha-hydroxylase/17,20 lyase-like [Styela clava]